MRTTTKLLSAALLLSLQLTGFNSYADICVDSFADAGEPIQTIAPARGIKPDAADFKQGQPLIEGGIDPDAVIRDQQCVGFCWAYGENELADQMSGTPNLTSPDHSGFWHFYFQMFQHPKYFALLSAKIAAKEITLEQAVNQAVFIATLRPGSKTAEAAGFTLNEGSNETIALSEAKIVGMVPTTQFNRPIATPDQANDLQAALKAVVQSVLTSSNQNVFFRTKDADGINSPLYSLMVAKLSPVLNAASSNNHAPFRPNDTFVHTDGKTYTPLTFMTEVLNFNTDDFVDVQMTKANQAMIYAAVKASLTLAKPIPVPMGWAVYQQKAGEQAGFWSSDLVQQGPVVLAGGHLTLIQNMRILNGQVEGVIYQNSWNEQGLDQNGNPSADKSQLGFNANTVGYNLYGVQQQEPPDFLFHKSIVNAQGPFSALLTSAKKK